MNQTENNNWGTTPGERIKWLRKLFSLSRQEFHTRLVETYGEKAPSYTGIQGWESNGKRPKAAYISMLSHFFQCPESFILGTSDDFGQLNQYLLQISPSELHLYDGEPVWVAITTKNSVISSYALVNAEQQCLVFKDKLSIQFDKLSSNAKIYSRNLYQGNMEYDPITLEMAKKLDQVYILEYNCTPQSSRYAGYYKYNLTTDTFEREDSKVLLRADAYGISYQAYTRIPPELSFNF